MAPKEENKYDYGAISLPKDDDLRWNGNSGESTGMPVKEGFPDDGETETNKLWFLRRSSSPYMVGASIALLFIIYRLAMMPSHGHGILSNPFHRGEGGGAGGVDSSTSEEESPSHSMSKFTFLTSPKEMGFHSTKRDEGISPSHILGDVSGPFPTNIWYLNLVSHRAAEVPDDSTSAYTVPYIIDTAAHAATQDVTAGIRIHWPVLQANDRNVQMVDDFKNSLIVGTGDSTMKGGTYHVSKDTPLSPLGVSLEWDGSSEKDKMVTHIVRGMPYATMTYEGDVLPRLFSYNGLSKESDGTILIDNNDGDGTTGTKLKCGMDGQSGETATVKNELEMHFINSDFTWIVFFNQPVSVRCHMSNGDEYTRQFHLEVVDYNTTDEPLVVRASILDQCTTGHSNIHLHCISKSNTAASKKQIGQMLRDHAHTYPTNPQIDFIYPNDSKNETKNAQMVIDWGSKNSSNEGIQTTNSTTSSLLMYALPHHKDFLDSSSTSEDSVATNYCHHTFHGRTCLVKGNIWNLNIDLGEPMSFTAPRPPAAEHIPTLVNALSEDIQYRMPNNLMRGAADTYFSGKILGRVARVIVIANELKDLASPSATVEQLKLKYYNDADLDDESLRRSMEAAASLKEKLPTDDEINESLDHMKLVVSTWLSKKAEAPFVYDESWGGFVNCGCHYVGYNDHGHCNNTFPDCPALRDVNEDFGNGFYNDHHYHYGYHMLAAAVAAKYDPAWGVEQFDRIMLYVRDFANPLDEDTYFPQFRQKDWFLGSSWASGIVSGENSPHGRNEESSSEAISAYEAVTLFGSAMVDALTKNMTSSSSTKDELLNEKLELAKLVQQSGQFLTATELHATNRYWHVWSSDTHNNTYPEAYKQPVVGMLYDTMASFQTWFAPQAVVSYGIQLLPLTPVAEARDDPEWAATLYPMYEQSCKTAGKFCVDNGWSILQAGLLATAGDPETAMDQALAVPTKVFSSDGGEGNSLTNTIWFISTRKKVENYTKSETATTSS